MEHGDEAEEEEKPQNEDEDGPTYKIIGQENEEKKTKPTRFALKLRKIKVFDPLRIKQGFLVKS